MQIKSTSWQLENEHEAFEAMLIGFETIELLVFFKTRICGATA